MIAATFIVGGALGAEAASKLSANLLRWLFIIYLIILAFIVLKKKSPSKINSNLKIGVEQDLTKAFLLIGLVGGFSSGLMGIGGGLAITALLIGFLGLSQHLAQVISLTVSVLPLTLPAVWVYVKNGETLPSITITYMVVGLIIGTSIGAIFANKLHPEKLRFCFVSLIFFMAAGMAWKTF
ncbi:MAG: sulfite exporter TauE/SafE family protein [Bacteriovorax sp.]|nr:sulfite exporter TauE/SafE family protein [Bacteriovorax sp.]